ncbi:hypothetical protein D9619_011140 [Psilocybe cf. subviscida]|uniref:Uncharacterized protein n=1 Tax=Psilocybe cf. subviscida TaxID=2480587 RepID=A0A8H5F576_9AGAR|nr:hypothetical protein D9619_011140 [Psilocybe cf. subviscida]
MDELCPGSQLQKTRFTSWVSPSVKKKRCYEPEAVCHSLLGRLGFGFLLSSASLPHISRASSSSSLYTHSLPRTIEQIAWIWTVTPPTSTIAIFFAQVAIPSYTPIVQPPDQIVMQLYSSLPGQHHCQHCQQRSQQQHYSLRQQCRWCPSRANPAWKIHGQVDALRSTSAAGLMLRAEAGTDILPVSTSTTSMDWVGAGWEGIEYE